MILATTWELVDIQWWHWMLVAVAVVLTLHTLEVQCQQYGLAVTKKPNWRRKVVHMALFLVGVGGYVLEANWRYSDYPNLLMPLVWIAGYLIAWLVFPRPQFHWLFWETRDSGNRAPDVGMLAFPLVMLWASLVLEPWTTTAVLGVLALGDGCASLVGARWPLRPLPWNRAKSWGGLLAFVLLGMTLYRLIAALVGETGVTIPWEYAPHLFVVAAIWESLPSRIDDNLRIGLLIFPAIAFVEYGVLYPGPSREPFLMF